MGECGEEDRAGVDERECSGLKIAARGNGLVILAIVLSALLALALNTGTVIVFFKPRELRFAEVPAWLLASLAGRDARRRLRFIMASREEARRAAVWERVERDIAAGREAARRPLPESPVLAAVRASGVTMEQAGRNLAAGLNAALAPRRTEPGAFETLVTEIRRKQRVRVEHGSSRDPRRLPWLLSECDRGEGHEVLWAEGRGRVCLTCERSR